MYKQLYMHTYNIPIVCVNASVSLSVLFWYTCTLKPPPSHIITNGLHYKIPVFQVYATLQINTNEIHHFIMSNSIDYSQYSEYFNG